MPSKPQSLEIISVNSSSVTVQWRPPATANGVIIQYSIFYNGFSFSISDFDNNLLMDIIVELSPDTVYVLQLRAYTVVGAGPPSNVTFLTGK